MSTFSQINFQNGGSLIMESMVYFHDHLLVIMIMIISFIFYLSAKLLSSKNFNNMFTESQVTEMVWTFSPAIILVVLALPSMKILYSMEESKTSVSLKVLGHQWYWSYEYPDFNLDFDSYMLKTMKGNFRLLDVDNRVVLPLFNKVRFVISSEDVIHSWSIPTLALKMDAVPGRLNQVSSMMGRSGLYFGQCSEICGANHSFMPIMLEVVPMKGFLSWV